MLGSERTKILAVAAAIAILALALRILRIGWSFSNNGVDEGIMLERALLVGKGLSLYTDIPCDQAPFWLLVGSLLEGGVVDSRLMDAALSVLAIIVCMWVARRIGGDLSMVICGLLLTFDFAFVRESRLFSLDAAATFFLAFSIPFLVSYARNGDRQLLLLGSVMIGLSAASKLHGGIALIGLLIFIAMENRGSERRAARNGARAAVAILGALFPFALLMAMLGPGEMIDGMVFNQIDREFEPFLKLSILAYFGTNLAYLLPVIFLRKMWNLGPENRMLLLIVLPLLAYVIIQPLLFYHHMVILSPLLAILAGNLISTVWSEKSCRIGSIFRRWNLEITAKPLLAVLLVGVVVSAGMTGYGLMAQQEPTQSYISKRLSDIAGEGDFVISGDPIIAAYAGVPVPPDVVNVAFRMHSDLTLDTIQSSIEEYQVVAVIVCYRLNELEGLPELLESEDYVRISPEYYLGGEAGALDLFQEGIEPISLFVQSAVAEELMLPIAS